MIHHLNCATLRPVVSFGGRVTPPRIVAHCLLVERADGLTLVDSGFGRDDLARPARLGRPFVAAMRPAFDPSETAAVRVVALGHRVEDVTDIVLTHLDLDHAGGISDFPRARVHVYGAELDAALSPTWREKARYIKEQWAHGPHWVRHEVAGDDWFGFEAVTALTRRRAAGAAPRPHPRPLRRRRPPARRRLAAARRRLLLRVGREGDAAPRHDRAAGLPAADGRRRRAARRQRGAAARAPRRPLGRGHRLQRPRRLGVRRARRARVGTSLPG